MQNGVEEDLPSDVCSIIRGCGVVLQTHLPAIKMRTSFWMRMLASLALAGLGSACTSEGPVNKSIAATVEKGPGTRLLLTEHTGFPWDKVCSSVHILRTTRSIH